MFTVFLISLGCAAVANYCIEMHTRIPEGMHRCQQLVAYMPEIHSGGFNTVSRRCTLDKDSLDYTLHIRNGSITSIDVDR